MLNDRVTKTHARCKKSHAVVKVNHPSSFYSLIFINTHSSLIRDFFPQYTILFPFQYECGALGEPFACQGTGSKNCLWHCYLHLPARSKNVLCGIDYLFIFIYIERYVFLSFLFECTQCNKSDRPEITITKINPKDSCCPLSLAVTAQRTLSAKWDVIKEEVAEAHFLYYTLLNSGFLKQHLKA